jgi:hypothetical protein
MPTVSLTESDFLNALPITADPIATAPGVASSETVYNGRYVGLPSGAVDVLNDLAIIWYILRRAETS